MVAVVTHQKIAIHPFTGSVSGKEYEVTPRGLDIHVEDIEDVETAPDRPVYCFRRKKHILVKPIYLVNGGF